MYCTLHSSGFHIRFFSADDECVAELSKRVSELEKVIRNLEEEKRALTTRFNEEKVNDNIRKGFGRALGGISSGFESIFGLSD